MMATVGKEINTLMRLEDVGERAQREMAYYLHVQGCDTCRTEHNRRHMSGERLLFHVDRKGDELQLFTAGFCQSGAAAIVLWGKASAEMLAHALRLPGPS